MTTAIYAFSGDPITYGHINIIERARKVFDQVIVAIGENPDKKYSFSLQKREEMAKKCFKDPAIRVLSFSNLLVDFAYEQGASVIIKGVRNSADFNYENILHFVGKSQKVGIDTHVLFADPKLAHISSSSVKSIAQHSGDIYEYVPLHVKEAIENGIYEKYIIGVTGEIGCGKSHISKQLSDYFMNTHNIELDDIAHEILNKLTEPAYKLVREDIVATFGITMQEDGFINRKILGDIVFNDYHKLRKLNEIMVKPIMIRLRKKISQKTGIILINCALLAETNMLHICNNNVILIKIDKETQHKRLLKRGLTKTQIDNRLNCQYDYKDKSIAITNCIDKDQHGNLWIIDNSKNIGALELYDQFKDISSCQ